MKAKENLKLTDYDRYSKNFYIRHVLTLECSVY